MSGTLFGGVFTGSAPVSMGSIANDSAVAGATLTDALNNLLRVRYSAAVTAANQDVLAAQLNTTIPCNRATAIVLVILPTLAATLGDTVTIYQMGAGQAEFSAGAGVLFRNGATYTNKTLEQWTAITAQYLGFFSQHEWLITGDRDPV
jgi:hypothetical protein